MKMPPQTPAQGGRRQPIYRALTTRITPSSKATTAKLWCKIACKHGLDSLEDALPQLHIQIGQTRWTPQCGLKLHAVTRSAPARASMTLRVVAFQVRHLQSHFTKSD